MEECEGREGARDEVEDGVEGGGRSAAEGREGVQCKLKSAKVQIGRRPVQRWNQISEYGVQITEER